MNSHPQRIARRPGRFACGLFGSRTTGFTLLEILVVLAIIGLLAGLAIVHVGQIHRQTEINAARLTVEDSLKTVLYNYKFSTGSYPSNAEGLRALLIRPENNSRWNGPYIEKAINLVDPWGEPYQYAYPGTHNKDGYDLWSKGPDKQGGTQDDITNWETSPAAPR